MLHTSIPLEGAAGGARRADQKVIGELDGLIDTGAATTAWQAALREPAWSRASVWIHGDLMPGNLLLECGALIGEVLVDASASDTLAASPMG